MAATCRLIVNADDLGLHAAINAGIARCHREGIVTSASLCPNGSAYDDALRMLRELPGLDVGVHLTLVGEAPLLPPSELPTLAPHGRLPRGFAALFRGIALRRVRLCEIEAELAAQLARVRDSGVSASHVDSHQHVHLHPTLLPVVMGLALRFGIGAIRAARRVAPLRGMKAALLGMFSAAAAGKVRAAGLRTPDTLVGAGDSGRLGGARLVHLIRGLRPGTSELLCHPGSDEDALSALYPDWDFRWDDETRALVAPQTREALTSAGAVLTSYREL